MDVWLSGERLHEREWPKMVKSAIFSKKVYCLLSVSHFLYKSIIIKILLISIRRFFREKQRLIFFINLNDKPLVHGILLKWKLFLYEPKQIQGFLMKGDTTLNITSQALLPKTGFSKRVFWEHFYSIKMWMLRKKFRMFKFFKAEKYIFFN